MILILTECVILPIINLFITENRRIQLYFLQLKISFVKNKTEECSMT
jgi:hypothetical protein